MIDKRTRACEGYMFISAISFSFSQCLPQMVPPPSFLPSFLHCLMMTLRMRKDKLVQKKTGEEIGLFMLCFTLSSMQLLYCTVPLLGLILVNVYFLHSLSSARLRIQCYGTLWFLKRSLWTVVEERGKEHTTMTKNG